MGEARTPGVVVTPTRNGRFHRAFRHYAVGRLTRSAYPNPFDSQTTLGYTLAEGGQVRLSVYDVLGREVAVLVSEEQAAGQYRTAWDAAGHTSGVYLVRLQVAGRVETQRVTVVE